MDSKTQDAFRVLKPLCDMGLFRVHWFAIFGNETMFPQESRCQVALVSIVQELEKSGDLERFVGLVREQYPRNPNLNKWLQQYAPSLVKESASSFTSYNRKSASNHQNQLRLLHASYWLAIITFFVFGVMFVTNVYQQETIVYTIQSDSDRVKENTVLISPSPMFLVLTRMINPIPTLVSLTPTHTPTITVHPTRRPTTRPTTETAKPTMKPNPPTKTSPTKIPAPSKP